MQDVQAEMASLRPRVQAQLDWVSGAGLHAVQARSDVGALSLWPYWTQGWDFDDCLVMLRSERRREICRCQTIKGWIEPILTQRTSRKLRIGVLPLSLYTLSAYYYCYYYYYILLG